MEKLELKHVACYLPYGLKCCLMGEKDEKTKRPMQFLIEGANTEYIEVWSRKTITDQWTYGDVFPILRPLSDLTKEIEYNGENFVPIIELSKLVDNGHNHAKSQVHKYSNYITVLTGKCDDVENVRFRFTIEGISDIESSGEVISLVTYDKIQTKLFEWHFDVFSLIDKGLAINLNTL